LDTGSRVYRQMLKSFPPDALAWVKKSTWTGPVELPFSAIDTDDIKSWSASKQPALVRKFAKKIAAGKAHTKPSIAIKGPDGYRLIDGHHRALARATVLKQDSIPAYVGDVPPSLVPQALETHSKQFTSTSADDDNARKLAGALALKSLSGTGIAKAAGLGLSLEDLATLYFPLAEHFISLQAQLTSLRSAVKKSRQPQQPENDGTSRWEGWDLSHVRRPPVIPYVNGRAHA